MLHIDPMFTEPAQLHNYNLKAKATQVLYTFVHVNRKPVTCFSTTLTEDERVITKFGRRKPTIRLCGTYLVRFTVVLLERSAFLSQVTLFPRYISLQRPNTIIIE